MTGSILHIQPNLRTQLKAKTQSMHNQCQSLLHILRYVSPLLRHLGHRNKVNLTMDKACNELQLLKELWEKKKMSAALLKTGKYTEMHAAIDDLESGFACL